MNKRARFYRWLYTWALKRWRASDKTSRIKHYKGRLTLHAILRYMERFEDRNLTAELLTPDVEAMIVKLGGSGKFVINGVLYTINDGQVLTIAKPNPTQAVVSGLSEKSGVPRKWSF